MRCCCAPVLLHSDMLVTRESISVMSRDRLDPEINMKDVEQVRLADRRFVATIQMPKHRAVGFSVARTVDRKALKIKDIGQGSVVEDWNHENPEEKIYANDFIVEVNGQTGADAMINEFVKGEGDVNQNVVAYEIVIQRRLRADKKLESRKGHDSP
mmetsp:Transcript_36946/g.98424  ORF Transcript_36946/g.98424 Transcript_36946/m.98424 type:complete len:156 (-) Transcript_36946:290-757(-)